MKPILYPQNTPKSGFSRNGLGFISHCTRCISTEERNGLYELSLDLMTTDRLAAQVVPGSFIKVKANPYDPLQLFEIYSSHITNNRITATAQHIRYIALANSLTESTTVQRRTPQQWWEYIEPILAVPTEFSFSSNVAAANAIRAAQLKPIRLGSFLMGEEGSMLESFGGEFHFDNFNIELLGRRGRDTGKCLRYGAHISTYEQSLDSTTCYTHIMPFAECTTKSSTGETLPSRAVYPETAIDLQNPNLTYKRVLVYDFSDYLQKEKFTLIEDETSGRISNWGDGVTLLMRAANEYISAKGAELTAPVANIIVDVPAALSQLADLRLCDTLDVIYSPLGAKTRAKVIRTEYDCLSETYTKIELGTARKKLASLFGGKNIGGA